MGHWKKNKKYSSTGNQLYTPGPNPSFGRNLSKDELGGVIFGCKNSTIKECLTKQLFGLPAQHFSYVKYIRPGLPLFLFNYTDRMLHGIFEAAGNGRMFIDPYGWTSDGSKVTEFPAQVQIRVQLHCRPLPEDKFQPAIEDNYHIHNHFWFELDHGQTNSLISLFKPLAIPITIVPANPVPQNTNPVTVSRFPPWQDPSWKAKAFNIPESKLEEHDSTTYSSIKSISNGSDLLLDECFQPLDSQSTDKEEATQNEQDLIWMKLKQMTTNRENQNISWENNEEENLDSPFEKEENPSFPSEKEENSSYSFEKEENSSSQLEHQYNMAQLDEHLVQEIKELKDFKKTQTERTNYLEKKLIAAELEIQILKDRCMLLESTCNVSFTHVDETVINASAELHLDAKDSLFLIGGFDGESSLAAMDMYCTSQNAIKPFKPMSHLRSFASVAELNGEIYVFGGGNDSAWFDSVESYNPIHDSWTLCPSLNKKKGSMSGAALDSKIFAVGGGNGVQSFSDVEMLDLDIGRWIPARSMLEKRFALAAVELNGVIYATGGYDGNYYLNSAERFDPREHSWSKIANMNSNRGCHSLVVLNEKLYALGGYDGNIMVPSVEVYDPRRGTWVMEETPMNHPRGYFAAAVVKDSIYVIGGVIGCQTIVETVESYKEGQDWKETYTSSNVKRCYMSAIACSHE